MRIDSLGLRTDLIFAQFSGEISDHGGYWVIRTPSNPTFWWGNFLLFKHAPKPEDTQPWLGLFALHFPEARHIALTWDEQNQGQIEGFTALGLQAESSLVLTAQSVHAPPKINTDAICRPLESPSDWEQWLELRMACNDRHGADEYRQYLKLKRFEYQRLEAAGRGRWFGAFLDVQMVCSLGLYHDGHNTKRTARFQSVETHPAFWRRGLCGSLVHFAAQYGLEHLKAQTLVMLADPEYHAARIYQSVGFHASEKTFQLERSGDLPKLQLAVQEGQSRTEV